MAYLNAGAPPGRVPSDPLRRGVFRKAMRLLRRDDRRGTPSFTQGAMSLEGLLAADYQRLAGYGSWPALREDLRRRDQMATGRSGRR